ncbi:MAG: helix-turn-helix domain-containing protein [Kiloniellaceae bacterium]|jgi:DNA-binding IclR family transcriptional regulator|nr:helix-turn-helix domain-containing protein [Kiloniellaceae bacterium]
MTRRYRATAIGQQGGPQVGDIVPSHDRQFVTALARGLEVLRAFRPGEANLSNQEIAERTALSKPTISRLTHTLVELGYLTHSASNGRYQLGPGVLALGYAMIAGLEVRERARPLMEQLAVTADATVAIGERDRLSVVYLDCCRGTQTVALSLNVGSRIPLGTTAMGRAIMAKLPEGEREYLLRALRERDPETYPKVESGLKQAISDLATYGFCTSFGDWRPDVNAIGVPVQSLNRERVFGLICGGPSFTASAEYLVEQVGPRLVQIARDLSAPPEATAPRLASS